MENKSIYILSLEAKDLYNADNMIFQNPQGYNIRYKDRKINTKKFKNSLDYSLEQIELRKIYKKIYRNKKFSFFIEDKEYSQQVINVNFSYCYNLYNKVFKDIYIKAGYDYKNLSFSDGVCIINNELVGIETNKKIISPVQEELLEGYFSIKKIEEENEVFYEYKKTNKNSVLKTPAELRKYLYKNGFICDGIKYVRYKRSNGSSRVGKCLFINQKLYKKIHKWELCGLNVKVGDEIDLAAFEGYISLTTSSIIDTVQIKPENILLIDDYFSEFEEDIVEITYNQNLESKRKISKIKNSLFDGQSLMDVSLFEKYKNKGMLLLRNRFFKSACFNTNIQKWFKDNNITEISQLNGKTRAKKIEDIKIITTPSSIKYLKFGSFDNWLDNIDTTFGIVKYEKPPYYFDGRFVHTHYQLINTLQLTKDDVAELLQDSFNYIYQIYNNVSILKYHIHYPEINDDISPMKNKNEIVFKLLGLNENFTKTNLYYDFRKSLINALMKELRQGHILVNGNYSTLLGNGIEMLQHSIGIFNGDSIIEKNAISSKRFEYGKTVLGSRSPHIVSGNILLAKNVQNSMIDKYFNMSKEIVYINAIGVNILQRLNGCDYDSDTILLTDNKLLVDKAQKNYSKFKVPTCYVKANKTKRHYTDEDKADLDIKTSVNKIGEIVNFSQYLNSILWNNVIGKNQTIEKNIGIYYDACKLAVLSGIEIDRSKKEFELDSKKEIDVLKQKYQIEKDDRIIKPIFFKNITSDNGYKINKNHKYVLFNTPMDYIQNHIKNFKKSIKTERETCNFISLVKSPEIQSYNRNDYRKRNKIISQIEKTKKETSIIFSQNTENKYERYKEEKEKCVKYINSIANTDYVIYLLLKLLDDKNYKHIHKMLFYCLFGLPNEKFFNMIVENKGNIKNLAEDKNGEIVLYGLSFTEC